MESDAEIIFVPDYNYYPFISPPPIWAESLRLLQESWKMKQPHFKEAFKQDLGEDKHSETCRCCMPIQLRFEWQNVGLSTDEAIMLRNRLVELLPLNNTDAPDQKGIT